MGAKYQANIEKREGLTLSFLLQNTYRSLIKTCDKVTNYSVSSGSGGEITLPDKNTVPSIHIVTLEVGSLLKIAPT